MLPLRGAAAWGLVLANPTFVLWPLCARLLAMDPARTEAANQDPTLQRLILIKGGVYGLIGKLFRGILCFKMCHPSPKFSKKM